MEKLLIVDGDRHIREALAARLRLIGHDTVEAGSGWSCLQHVEKQQVAQVVLNERLPDMDGFEVLEIVSKKDPGLPVLFILENADQQNRTRATRLGACEVLEKPLPLNRLVASLVACQEKFQAKKQASVAELLAMQPRPSEA